MHNTGGHVTVKLPKLETQHFDENIINWKSFWDRFEGSIHFNLSISGSKKIKWLCIWLRSSVYPDFANYDAIKILEERFRNTQIFISTCIQQFVSLLKIKSPNDVLGIWKLNEKVGNTVRNLQTFGTEPGSCGQLLTLLINENLPHKRNFLTAQKFDSNVWSLSEMLL